jgi:hypothetical protein
MKLYFANIIGCDDIEIDDKCLISFYLKDVYFLLQKRTLLRFLSSFFSLNFIECLFCGGGWT